MKPRRGSGGIGVRLASEQEIAAPPRGCYLQQLVGGLPASAVFVAARGSAMLLGATRQLIGRDFGLARPFLYAGSIGPLPLSASVRVRLQRLGELLAELFDLVGIFNVDFVVAEDEVWVLEVNPRYSASVEVLELATGVAYVGYHAAACCQGELPRLSPAMGNSLFGKAICYARRDGNVPMKLDALAALWMHEDGREAVADLPRIGERFSAGQPVVTVLASGDSMAEVEDTLRSRCGSLQAELVGIAHPT